MKKQLMIVLAGIVLAGTTFAAEKSSPEAKEVHAAKLISCVNAKTTKAPAAADLGCDKFKNLDKTVQSYTDGKIPRGLSAAASKLEKVDLASLSASDKKLIEAAKATDVYKKLKK